MKDQTPSLFDFDDESCFPKQEDKKKITKDSHPKEADSKITEKTAEVSVGETAENPFGKPILELPQTGKKEDEISEAEEVNSTPAYKKQVVEAEKVSPKRASFFFEPPEETSTNFLEMEEAVPVIVSEVVEKDDEPAPENINATTFLEKNDLPEWQLEKKYYTIGEVAKLFDVNVSNIRFWSNEFKIKTRTTRKKDRLFAPRQIEELRLIHHLVKVKKYTLKGAKEALKSGSSQLEKKLDIREELQKLHQTLLEIRESL